MKNEAEEVQGAVQVNCLSEIPWSKAVILLGGDFAPHQLPYPYHQ